MTEEKTPGQIAFEAYRESVGGVAVNGLPIPPWANVKDSIRYGWEDAAMAVIRWFEGKGVDNGGQGLQVSTD